MPGAKEVGREITNYLWKTTMFSYMSGFGGKHIHPLKCCCPSHSNEIKADNRWKLSQGSLRITKIQNIFMGRRYSFLSTGPWTTGLTSELECVWLVSFEWQLPVESAQIGRVERRIGLFLEQWIHPCSVGLTLTHVQILMSEQKENNLLQTAEAKQL